MSTTATITKPLMIELEGKGPLKLEPKAYVVSGGEGAIYKPSSELIIKLYHDRDKMRHDGMPQKLTLLSKINSPFIVNPKGLVYENQQPIGYYMKFEEGESLAKVITSAYRQRENFGDKDAIILVDNMRQAVKAAHDHSAIMVDANELNWIVKRKKGLVEPKSLDVDSWKIDHWDASVIMLSIRDWHTKGFNEGSDWFSWGVVTFQVFAGIHPYKGGLDGFKMNDIESRMKANKSVFTPNVRLNSAVRDFNCIPGPLLDWYEAVFQSGDRSMPPSPNDVSNKAPKAAVRQRGIIINTNGDMVKLDKLYDSHEWPIYIFSCGVVRTMHDSLVDLSTGTVYQKRVTGVTCEVISTQYGNLLAEIAIDGKLTFTLLSRDGKATPVPSAMSGSGLMRYQNRLFVCGPNGLTEVGVKMYAAPVLTMINTWQYLFNSTRWFNGVGIQDALGAMYLITPFGDKACEYIRTRELDGEKVVNAMAGTRYVVAITLDSKTGEYSRHEFIFDSNYKSYAYKHAICSTSELNTAMLPKGVIAYIVDDGHMVIEAPVSGNATDVKDSKIKSSFTMFNFENRVVYTDDHQVWAVSLK